jgi:hypothetical protein
MSGIIYHYAECRNSQCPYAECHSAKWHTECHYAECRGAIKSYLRNDPKTNDAFFSFFLSSNAASATTVKEFLETAKEEFEEKWKNPVKVRTFFKKYFFNFIFHFYFQFKTFWTMPRKTLRTDGPEMTK